MYISDKYRYFGDIEPLLLEDSHEYALSPYSDQEDVRCPRDSAVRSASGAGRKPGEHSEDLWTAGMPLSTRGEAYGQLPDFQGSGQDPHGVCTPGDVGGCQGMGCRTSTDEKTFSGDFTVGDSSDSSSCDDTAPKGGKAVGLGSAFVKTVRHYWPELDGWLSVLPDSRFQPFVEYDRKFLLWWGLLLFCLKLGSRRQLDYELRDMESSVLDNVNRLAGTRQKSLPVHKTLAHFLGHVGSTAIAGLRTDCMRRLIRMKALDDYRLHGALVVALDGTGYLTFSKRHCPACLSRKHDDSTVYFHPVLEAKVVTTSGLALSIGSEFIRNTDVCAVKQGGDYESHKQDCELKAFVRMAPQLKKRFPQTPVCITGDSLFGCGTAMHICKEMGWFFVATFKSGRTAALWSEFQGRLKLEPGNARRITRPNGIKQCFRWVKDLHHVDDQERTHVLNAILCEETIEGKTTTFAWLTTLPVSANTVDTIACKGGRIRFTIENQGFNMQKNSGLNLEHAYGYGVDTIYAFYYLLQIAHIFLQLLEKGSLLKQIARRNKTTPRALFGSLKNIARRLLECFRYFHIPNEDFRPYPSPKLKIRLDSG
jgi:hypothetical protein